MKINKYIAGSVIGMSLLVGTIGGSIAFAQTPAGSGSGQDQIETPAYSGSITVDQTKYEGMSETDEAGALQGQAKITADEARAAAEAANAGAKATKVELDNENGVLVYSVELDNGLDVKVDAGNGSIVHTEQAGSDNEVNDQDNTQEEHENQADDASEAPGVEDAAGQ